METSVKHHYNRMYHHLLFFTLVLHLGHIHPAMASDLSLGGHLKTQTSHSDFDSNNLIDQLGPERPTTQTLDLRTNSAVSHGSLELVAQAEFLALISDNLAARKDLARQLGELQPDRLLPTDNRRLFDFSKEIVDANKVQAVARLDRLYLVHSDESTVLKAGRQAISWGNGLVFHTFDLFNPFSPVEIDRDYKPGDDMLYAQQLFANGADLQLLAVVRRDTLTNNVKDSASSYASKFHARLEEIDLDYELLVARHYEDHLAGFGLSRSFFGAVWRTDILYTREDSERDFVQLVANLDRSWFICGKNVYAYLEYYYNGVGSSDDNYSRIAPQLRERVDHGELFTLGRNYLSLGTRVEVTPLFNIFLNQILNLNDTSGFFQYRGELELTQSTALLFGINIPFGGVGSEFGGIPIAEDTILAASKDIYARLAWFF